jgi:hypothetical protein
MNNEKMKSNFDYDIENLDTSDKKKYLDKINLYDLPFLPGIILSQIKENEMKELFKNKFEKILNDIRTLKFNNLSILYLKISKICIYLKKYNCYFNNYDSEKPTDNFFTFKKLLIFISYKIINDKKDIMLDDKNLIDIINGYLNYKKTNEKGYYILYNSLLNNIFKKYSIDMYCNDAINFCIENNIEKIENLDDYNYIHNKIKENIKKTKNGNYYYDSTNQTVKSSNQTDKSSNQTVKSSNQTDKSKYEIINILLDNNNKKEFTNQFTNQSYLSKTNQPINSFIY